MHWTEPASSNDFHAELENTFWAAANQLWASAALKPSKFSPPPVLGLIFNATLACLPQVAANGLRFFPL